MTEGRLRIVYGCDGKTTRHREAYQQGALKVRFPKSTAGEPPEAVMINTAGGLTGGDRLAVEVEADDDAHGVVTGQACERIYRSASGEAAMETRIAIADRARIDWLPQPTILFDQGRFCRQTQIDIAQNATLLGVESIIFGRTAMGEVVEYGRVEDDWRVRRDGKLIFADGLRLDGAIDAHLRKRSVLAGHRAMASILYVATDAEARLDPMRGLLGQTGVIAAASAWDGILSARLVASDGQGLTKALLQVLTGFRARPMPRVWTI